MEKNISPKLGENEKRVHLLFVSQPDLKERLGNRELCNLHVRCATQKDYITAEQRTRSTRSRIWTIKGVVIDAGGGIICVQHEIPSFERKLN